MAGPPWEASTSPAHLRLGLLQPRAVPALPQRRLRPQERLPGEGRGQRPTHRWRRSRRSGSWPWWPAAPCGWRGAGGSSSPAALRARPGRPAPGWHPQACNSNVSGSPLQGRCLQHQQNASPRSRCSPCRVPEQPLDCQKLEEGLCHTDSPKDVPLGCKNPDLANWEQKDKSAPSFSSSHLGAQTL